MNSLLTFVLGFALGMFLFWDKLRPARDSISDWAAKRGKDVNDNKKGGN